MKYVWVLGCLILVLFGSAGDVSAAIAPTKIAFLLENYSKETSALKRNEMALQIVPRIQRLIHSGGFSQFSHSQQKVIENAGQFYQWARGRVRHIEKSLTGDERLFIASGAQDSLVPFGGPIVSASAASCDQRHLQKIASLFGPRQDFKTILNLYVELMTLDQHMNQRYYFQQLERIVQARDNTPYKTLILQYLSSRSQDLYEAQPESKKVALFFENVFQERQRLLKKLSQKGVVRPKATFAKIMSMTKGCSLK